MLRHSRHSSRHTRHFKRRKHHKTAIDGSRIVQHIGNRAEPVPERLYCELKFMSDPLNLMLQPAGPQFKSWYLNGPYDPDPSLGGLTTAYFTELGLSYQYYNCYGSSCKVYAAANSSSDAPAVVAVLPCLTTSTGSLQVPTDFASMIVTPGAKWAYVNEFDAPLAVVHNKELIRNYQGQLPEGGLTWQGTAPGKTKTILSGSNPTQLLYWVVGVYDTSGVAGDANIFVQIEITYFVEFVQRTCPIGYNNASFLENIDPVTDQPSEQQPPPVPKKEPLTDSVIITKLKDLIK